MGIDKKSKGLKVDLGCGGSRREGFIRVDNNSKCAPDVCMDMQDYVKTLDDNSVSEAWVMHSIEFLDGWEIYAFVNDLYRVVKVEGILKIAVTSVTLPRGGINPRAWTVPLLKTHFSPNSFIPFENGSPYRGVLPWTILKKEHCPSGGLVVTMTPQKEND